MAASDYINVYKNNPTAPQFQRAARFLLRLISHWMQAKTNQRPSSWEFAPKQVISLRAYPLPTKTTPTTE